MKRKLFVLSLVVLLSLSLIAATVSIDSLKEKATILGETLKSQEINISIAEFDELAGELDAITSELSEENLDEINSRLNEIEYRLAPSNALETRGIWIMAGSVDRWGSREGMIEALTQLRDLGYNTIYMILNLATKCENIPEGTRSTISWSDDAFQAIIEEAHKLDIEVHGWGACFVVGSGARTNEFMKAHPDWLETNKEGQVYWEGSKEAWISHSNPETRAYVLGKWTSLVNEYPEMDGINLDFIRYSAGLGYDQYSVDKFKEETGIDALLINDSREAAIWAQWQENHVTTMVKEISEAVKEIKPDIAVNADVMTVNRLNRQNWLNWVVNGYIDTVIPMNYINDNTVYDVSNKRQRSMVKDMAYLLAGIGEYDFPRKEQLYEQLASCSDIDDGSVTYAYYRLFNRADTSILPKSVFRNPAVPVTSPLDVICDAQFNVILSKVAVWYERGLVDSSTEKWLENKFDSIEEIASAGDEAMFEIFDEIFITKLEASEFISDERVLAELTKDLNAVINVIKPRLYKVSREGKEIVLPELPELSAEEIKNLDMPVFNVPGVETAPAIDGVEDEAWNAVDWSQPFVMYNEGTRPNNLTSVKLLHDNDNVYVLYKVNESAMDKISSFDGEKDTKVYMGDSVEMFVQPDQEKQTYYHVVMSANGTIYDEVGYDFSWNGDEEAAASRYDGYYLIEVRMNLSSLGTDLTDPNTAIRMNFNRSRWADLAEPAYTCWSCTYGSFHNPSRFGKVYFK